MRRPTFDPADHLAKQGWKGKGTALRDGHAKRPIAVVQKKTLSGIGKDRDEAIPFWDHIFASTAASLASSNASPSASGTSTPVAKPAPKPVISIAARSGKEIAKRKLYSGFLRGSVQTTPVTFEEETETDVSAELEDKPKRPKEVVKESKEERKARREERRLRKEEKLASRAAKAERKALKAAKSRSKEERRAKREAKRARRSGEA